jgi:hypothetical protein
MGPHPGREVLVSLLSRGSADILHVLKYITWIFGLEEEYSVLLKHEARKFGE